MSSRISEATHFLASRACLRILLLAGPTLIFLTFGAVRDLSAHSSDVFTSGAPAEAATAAPMEAQTGAHSVSMSTGAASYAVAMPLPPGRAGMAPSVSLQYSSNGPEKGGLAVGWSMPIPAIEVDTRGGRLAGTFYASSLAGGQRLVEIDEPSVNTAGVRTFRGMHDDSWTRYERVETGTDVTWRVRTTDGKTYYFGEGKAKDAPWHNEYGSEARYFVSRIVDRFGNTIRYKYDHVLGAAVNGAIVDNVDVRLKRIEYTSHGSDDSHHAEVRFSYSEPEFCSGSHVPVGARFSMRSGIRLYEGSSRLDAISTWVADSPGAAFRAVREMRLVYSDIDACNSLDGLVRVLDRIEQTGYSTNDSNGTPAPTLSFEYGNAARSFNAAKDASALQGGVAKGARRYNLSKAGGWPTIDRMLLDFDGDGRLDILEVGAAEAKDCVFTWRKNLGRAGFDTPRTELLPRLPWKASSPGEYEGCSLSAQFSERTTPDVFTPPIPAGARGANYTSYRFMDLDGDGQAELVSALDYRYDRYSPTADPDLSATGAPPAAGPIRCRAPDGSPIACRMREIDGVGYSAVLDGGGVPTGSTTCGWEECPAPGCSGDCSCSWENCFNRAAATAPSYRSDDGSGWESPFQDYESPVSPDFDPGAGYFVPMAQLPQMEGADYIFRVHDIGGTTLGPVDFATTTLELGTGAAPAAPLANSLLDATPQVRRSPIPLEGVFGSGRLGAGRLAEADSWHGFVDMDGDGILDAVFQHPTHMYFDFGSYWNGEFLVFRGDGTGNFYGKDAAGSPYLWTVPQGPRARIHLARSGINGAVWDGPPPESGDDVANYRYTETEVQLLDVNGDGLVDYVENREREGLPRRLRVFYNTGVGFEHLPVTTDDEFPGTVLSDEFTSFSRQESRTLRRFGDSAGSPIQDGWSQEVRRSVDLNRDGLPDVVALPGIEVGQPNPWWNLDNPEPQYGGDFYVNTGDRLVQVANTPSGIRAHQAAFGRITVSNGDSWTVLSDVIDVDGDGVSELFPNNGVSCTVSLGEPMPGTCGSSTVSYGDMLSAPRLLTSVRNGSGGTITFSYSDGEVEVTESPDASPATITADSNKFRIPATTKVVYAVTVSAGAGSPPMTTSYKYHNPVSAWDELQLFGFRGFQRSLATGGENGQALAVQTVESFDYNVDPTGRLVTTEIREVVDGAAQTRSVSDDVWQRHESFGGAVVTYHTGESRTYTCPSEPPVLAAVDGAQTCRDLGLVVRQVTSWAPIYTVGESTAADVLDGYTVATSSAPQEFPLPSEQLIARSFVAPSTLPSRAVVKASIDVASPLVIADGNRIASRADAFLAEPATDDHLCNKGAPAPTTFPVGTPVTMHVPCGVRITKSLGDVEDGDLGVSQQFALVQTADSYLLLGTDTRRYVARQPGTGDVWNGAELIGWRKTIFDDHGLGLPAELRVFSDPTSASIVRRGFDCEFGVPVWSQSPSQVDRTGGSLDACGAAPPMSTRIEYDSQRLHPRRTVNARGHAATVLIDNATGLPLTQSGIEQIGSSDTLRVRTAYDGLGRAVATYRTVVSDTGLVEDALVRQTVYTDYADGEPTRVRTSVRTEYEPEQWLVSEQTFDGIGRPLAEVDDPDGIHATTSYQYDATGHPVSITVPDPRGTGVVEYNYQFDSEGRVVRLIPPGPSGAAAPAAATAVRYNGLRVTTSEEAHDDGPALTTIRDYDVYGQLRAVTEDPTTFDSVTGDITHAGVDAITSYEYDPNGYVVGMTDADAVVTRMRNDFRGRRLAIARGRDSNELIAALDGSFSPTARAWRYAYDADGQLICERPPVPWDAPPVTSAMYAMPSETSPLCEDPGNPWEISLVYDDIGRLVRTNAGPRGLDAEAQARYSIGETTFEYDDALEIPYGWGRLRRIRHGVRGATQLATFEYDYDLVGRPIREQRQVRTTPWESYWLADERMTEWEYNVAGQLVRTRHADDEVDPTTTIQQFEGSRGLPSALQLIVGSGAAAEPVDLVTISRNSAGLPVRRLSRDIARYQYQSIQYDELGRIKEHYIRAFPCEGCNFTVVAGEDLSYRSTGDVRSIRYKGGAGLTLWFKYDDRHQLTYARSDADAGGTYLADFAYTPGGRVATSWVRPSTAGWDVFPRDVVHDYGAAGVGGLVPDVAAVRQLLPNPARSEDTTPLATFGYDERGSLVRKEANGETLTFAYDGNHQLREAVNHTAGTREIYYYDPTGQRILSFRTALDASGVLAREWVGETEVEFRSVGDALVQDKTTVHATLGGTPVAQIENGDVEHPRTVYQGALGNLLAVLDADGVAIARFAYGPFGEILWKDGELVSHQHRLFGGKELDEVTQLSYFGYRYYDRLSMSWTQPDPKYLFAPEQAGSQPRRAALYSFSLNNPMRFYDANGLDPDGAGSAATRQEREECAKAGGTMMEGSNGTPTCTITVCGGPGCKKTSGDGDGGGGGGDKKPAGSRYRSASDAHAAAHGTSPTSLPSDGYGEFVHWLPFVGPALGMTRAAADARDAWNRGSFWGVAGHGALIAANGLFLYLDVVTFGNSSWLRGVLGASIRNGVRRVAHVLARASDLATLRPGTTAWENAVSDLRGVGKGKRNYRTETATDAKQLLEESRGSMDRRKQYTQDNYKKGFEVHNSKNARELGAGNDLQHVKWKDGKAGGHIYYDKPN